MMFRPFEITVKRYSAGTWSHGVFTNGASTEFNVIAGIQSPTPNDLELLDEGKRTRKVYVVFTEAALQLASNTTNADQVKIENEWFEVSSLKKYRTNFPGNYRSIVIKIENEKDLPEDS